MGNKIIFGTILILIILFIITACTHRPACGNDIVEEGETQETCCEDVGCDDNDDNTKDICREHKCFFEKKTICDYATLNTQTIIDSSEQNIQDSINVINASLSQIASSLVMDMHLKRKAISYNGCYKFLIDEDMNSNTGLEVRGALGVEFFVTVCGYNTRWNFGIDSNQDVRDKTIDYSIDENHIKMVVKGDIIKTEKFGWSFETFNNDGQDNNNEVSEFTVSDTDVELLISSNNLVTKNPLLINVPYNSRVKLNVGLNIDQEVIPVDINNIEFSLIHPPADQDPESIISIDSEGYAHYNNAGYVSVSASLKDCPIYSDDTIIAGGNVYGDPVNDNVIAVFPQKFKPRNSQYTFGDMMDNYPDFIRTVNLAYRITSELYNGFEPYNGDKQVLALLDIPDHCGGNNNPLETAPCCYMNCGDGTPMYNVIIHEMGHNFGTNKGMLQFASSLRGRIIDGAGFGECSASLPVIYIASEIYNNPEKYGISKDDFEWKYYRDFLQQDIPYAQSQLQNFENLINSGEISGVFDNNGKFDGVAAFCSFFQLYSYDITEEDNPYNNEIIKRFLNIFEDKELENFEEGKAETYFAAAYSSAIGHDMRSKLRFWGFTIDDNYFNKIYPQLSQKVE